VNWGELLTQRKQKLFAYYERDPEQVAKYKKINYPVIVDEKYFDSLNEASKSLKINRQTITNRCNSAAFPNYIYLKDTKNKIILIYRLFNSSNYIGYSIFL